MGVDLVSEGGLDTYAHASDLDAPAGGRRRWASSRKTYRNPSGVVEHPEVLAALRLQLGQLLAVDLPDARG
jgi:hypothetical protein